MQIPAQKKNLIVSSDDTSDEEYNIPLSSLLSTKTSGPFKPKRPVKRKLLNTDDIDECIDDEDADATYVPSGSESNSSDSDENEMLEKPTSNNSFKKIVNKVKDGNKKRKLRMRQKQWMKTPTRIRTSKRPVKQVAANSESRRIAEKLAKRIQQLQTQRKSPKHNENDLEKAKRKSLQAQSVRAIIQKYHVKRLDQLLHGNDLKRVPITSDGNCFFSAFAKSADIDTDILKFREDICDYMIDNVHRYIEFCVANNPENEYRDEQFCSDIETLKSSGEWNVNLADCLPLATADKFDCTVRIYSSAINTPVYDIKPPSTTSANKVVHLAYLAIRGEEHYEAVQRCDVTNHDPTIEENLSHSLNMSEDETTENPSIGADLDENDELDTDEETAEQNESPCVTPHKRADYQSPPKKVSSRKKRSNPTKWKRNVRKTQRISGKAYISVKGKQVGEKIVKPQDCSKCRFKCNEKISEECRQQIFCFYYGLESYERQRAFICDMICKVKPARSKGNKSISLQYHLPAGDKKERVCRDFFQKTLDVGRKTIDYTVTRKKHGSFSGTDRRGKHAPKNKIDKETLDFVHRHIQSFPKMESHYSRKKTKKEYLAPDLNIKQMWRLYKEECEKQGLIPVKQGKYRQVFCEFYNLSFFKPKKDQCSLCERYNRAKETGNVGEDLKTEYSDHQKMKSIAREEKEKDKSKSKQDSQFYTATFDLQAVLTTPCSLISELYYSRKLCCYNLTIYSLGDKKGVCHLWDETQGKRGSCEIATCLMKNTLSVCSPSSGIKEITYYSDTCGGQNRNQFVSASLLYSLSMLTINQKFLQSGHSHMECDSVHSAIETTKKKTSIYVPSEWSTIVNVARKHDPYIAVPLKFDHILDFKEFAKKHCPNLRTAKTGERINWLKIRWIQARKSSPRSLFVNYSYCDSSFIEIDVQARSTRAKGKESKWPEQLNKCYNRKLPISIQKKADLVELCHKGIIPEDYHPYFENLPVDKKAKDKAPVPALSDDSDYSDSE